MNKTQLVEAIAKKADLSKGKAQAALDAALETIIKAVKKKDTVQLIGFGTFSQTKRAARKGINPQTKEVIKIAACKAPRFKAGRAFKAAINGK